jgi:hypothetical protein
LGGRKRWTLSATESDKIKRRTGIPTPGTGAPARVTSYLKGFSSDHEPYPLLFHKTVLSTCSVVFRCTSSNDPHFSSWLCCLPRQSFLLSLFTLSNLSLRQGLQLAQTRLSHEKHMDAAQQRVTILEGHVQQLQHTRDQNTVPSVIPPAIPSVSQSSRSRWLW